MSVEGIFVLASLLVPVLATFFWHVRAYSLYKLLGGRVGNVSYYWFCFQFQTPGIAREFPGFVDLFSSLPEDLAAKVFVVRRDTKRAEVAMLFWILLFVTLLGISFRH
jgi:hypothetical protein